MSGALPADLRAAAALGGEMGRRLAAFDWARHPLGDPADWPAAVRATVATALASRFPMVLWLGDRLRLIYNDAYIPVLGDRHPAALITDAGGSTRYLTGSRRYPLAARADREPSPAAGRAAIPAGSLLLLYTDGLVERRDEPLDTGLARLAATAARCARLSAAACALLLEQMAPAGGYGDDVALVAVRPAGSTPASHVDVLPADLTAMAAARARLAAWLGGLDAMTPAQSHSIVLGTGKALTNAIEHGSGGDPERAVTVEAFAHSGEIAVTVGDSGYWTKSTADAARADGRGRGLRLIHGLASGVQTVSGPRGTRVTMTYRVPSGRRESVRR